MLAVPVESNSLRGATTWQHPLPRVALEKQGADFDETSAQSVKKFGAEFYENEVF